MPTRFLVPILAALSTAAVAAGIECPKGAVGNGQQTPGGTVAWCELEADRALFHGPFRAWYPNGVLGTEERYVRGKANGEAAYRWGSGHKQAQGGYKDGIRDGWWNFWDKTGLHAGRVRYRDGAVVSGQLPKWAADWPPTPAAQRPSPQP